MTEHRIRVEDAGRGDQPYRWVCSCGRKGRHPYGFVGLAERAGLHHASTASKRP